MTIQIQKLEKELDVQLFERIGKRVYLTDKGQEFIFYAGEIMKASHAALAFSKSGTTPKGKLRIGGVESICTALLPGLLLDFHRLFPQVELVIRSGTTDEMIALAESNELDLVFTLDEKIFRPELICAAQQTEDVVFVTRAGSLPDTNSLISIERLCRQPFLLTETGAAYRYRLEQLLAERELKVEPILEIGNTETIINLLKKGMGISFLPRFTVENHLKSGRLVQLQTDLPGVQMYHQLFYHKSKWVTEPMRCFIRLVKKHFGLLP